jgi:hypothetical protein
LVLGIALQPNAVGKAATATAAGTAASSKEIKGALHGSRIFFCIIWISTDRVDEGFTECP